jgi:hypothetical protein
MGRTATPTVLIAVAHGELVDKITILEIKNERMSDAAKLANVRRELEVLAAARDAAMPPSPELAAITAELKSVNERLWEVEDRIRDCERRRDFGAEFIELARTVYKTNDVRSELKRKINLLCGAAFLEEKSYTAY